VDSIPGFDVMADTDGDRIADSIDQCPSEPETWNKYADTDGCPDSLADLEN
jgi:hypothetical protein